METYVIIYNALDNKSSLCFCYENISGKNPKDALLLRFGKCFVRLTGDAARFAAVIIVKGTYEAETGTIIHKGRYMRLCYGINEQAITLKGVGNIKREWEIGDTAYLIKPVKGYRRVEIVGFDGVRLVVRTESGWELTIYEDELEDA